LVEKPGWVLSSRYLINHGRRGGGG